MKIIINTYKLVMLVIVLAYFPLKGSAQELQNSSDEIKRAANGLAKQINFQVQSTTIGSGVGGSVFLLQKLNLKDPYGFKLLDQNADNLGMIHYRYQLTYKGYPVEHTMYMLHTKQGIPTSANGDYVNNISININNIIPEEVAIEAAYKAENLEFNTQRKGWVNDNLKVVAEQKIIYLQAEGIYKLVYDVNVVESIGHMHRIAVDATTGKVVRKENTFKCAKVHTIYSGEQEVTTLDSGGKFYLHDKTRNLRTFDGQAKSFQGNGEPDAVLVENTTDVWQEADYSTGALDAHFAATSAYDYFLNVHGRKSYDGKGSEVRSYVNVDIGQPNAFWGGFMVIAKPEQGILLATIDIVGHELSHGVSQTSARFGNQGEASALNEAYSDMFGAMIENMVYPSYPDSLNYQTGEQFSNMGRNFIDPAKTNNPAYYKGERWDNTNNDNHGNGVVHSHWMYLVAEGHSNYTNEKNETYTIKGIGREKVAKILYRTLTVYLTPNAGFKEAMEYSIQSAKELYGACSDEVATVKQVWKAVGLEVDDDPAANAEFSVTKSYCLSPVQLSLVNTKGSNKTYNWDFGDGTTSTTASPTKTYAASGSYKIKLNVVGCGNDNASFEQTIEVDNNQFCDSTTVTLNGKGSVESCKGIYRSGTDTDGKYFGNNTSEYTIRNTTNKPYIIEFLNFEMGYFSDRLEVYDGIGTSGTKLAEFSITNPPTGKINSTTGAVTFKETTDGFRDYDGSGYEVYYECNKAASPNSVRKIDNEKIRVWPNPATSKLNIYHSENIKSYKLTDISGKTLVAESLGAVGNTAVIDLNSIAGGVYFILVETTENVFTEKIIIQGN